MILCHILKSPWSIFSQKSYKNLVTMTTVRLRCEHKRHMIVLLYISVTCQSCKILKYCCEFLLASPSSVESLVLSWNSVKFVNNNAGYHKNYEMIPFPLFNWPSNYYEKLDHNFFFINGHGEFWIDNIITILSNRITPKIQIVFPKFSPLEKSTIVEKMYNFERCVSSWAKLYNSASTPLLWIWHRCVNSRARYFSKKSSSISRVQS